MRIAIVQPLYLPWIGYFDLVRRSDIFVFLDHVQFERRSWQNRNRIKTPHGSKWLTVPVEKKGRLHQTIQETLIRNDLDWEEGHRKSIVHNYSASKSFAEYSAMIDDVYTKRWEYLADLNIFLVKLIGERVGIKRRYLKSSELGVGGTKTELLVNICKSVGADEYITGPSAKNYIRPELFDNNNIKLTYHEFVHPVYRQLNGEFIPYLSAIDLLLNCGEDSHRIVWGNSLG